MVRGFRTKANVEITSTHFCKCFSDKQTALFVYLVVQIDMVHRYSINLDGVDILRCFIFLSVVEAIDDDLFMKA